MDGSSPPSTPNEDSCSKRHAIPKPEVARHGRLLAPVHDEAKTTTALHIHLEARHGWFSPINSMMRFTRAFLSGALRSTFAIGAILLIVTVVMEFLGIIDAH
jgi:hypothetical protein